MGSWTFVSPRLDYILGMIDDKGRRPFYVGREAAASPATGQAKKHKLEQENLVNEALSVEIKKLPQPFQPQN